MAITQRTAPTTITALDHAFEATADTAVTSIHLCNITSSDATIDVYLLPDDGSTTVPTENNKIYNSLTIQATDSYSNSFNHRTIDSWVGMSKTEYWTAVH
jgi:hypothetical protein